MKFSIFKKPDRRIISQIDEFIKEFSEVYVIAAVSYYEYLLKFLEFTDASDVTKIKEAEVSKFMCYIKDEYASTFVHEQAGKAVRAFVRNFRAKGFPTLTPEEIMRACKV